MSRIRGKNTKPEIFVRKFLYSQGIRYRIHSKLPGKPDIVIRKSKLAVFINGCFWHGHKNCKDFSLPKTRTDFWKNKIEGNRLRDRKNSASLRKSGWHVLIIWECELQKNKEKTLGLLLQEVTSARIQ